MRLLYFLSILVIVLQFGCSKESTDCPAPYEVEIVTNGPQIVEGTTLTMQTYDAFLKYRWTGPNGWKYESETLGNIHDYQERPNMTMQDAGEYKVELLNEAGCALYAGKVMIEVIAPPSAPCNVPANTSTSSVVGVGDYNFTNRSFVGGGDVYAVTVSEGALGEFMRLNFLGNNPPIPRIYTTSATGSFAHEPDKVGLFISSGTEHIQAEPNQKVYVTKENNKLVIAFCSLKFNNPFNAASPIIVSAKIIQP